MGRAVPLLPALVLLVIFLLGPVISSFYGSFTNSALTGAGAADQQFVGLKNYVELFQDPDFPKSVILTIVFLLASAVVGQNVLGQAAMPTQNGQAPGYTSMSGGWTLAVGSKSKNPKMAFDFITTFLDKDGSLKYDIDNSQIAVRKDVAEDPSYDASNPTFKFFSGLVEHTNFRPATSDYSQVSNAIQVAMESVMTGQQTPKEAAAAYDQAVEQVVGKDGTVSAR